MEPRNIVLMILIAGALGACASDASSGRTPTAMDVEECKPGFVCDIEGLPFVRQALPNTDAWSPPDPYPPPSGTTGVVTQPERGRLCMSGRLEQGWAFMTLVFAHIDATGVRDPFEATRFGITTVQFTLESPPQMGLSVELVSAVPDCMGSPADCQHWGFYLGDNGGTSVFITNQPGVVTAPFADFVKTGTADPSWEFDPGHLATLQIGAGAFQSVTGDYDFCVRDLKFLDASGSEVTLGPEGSAEGVHKLRGGPARKVAPSSL